MTCVDHNSTQYYSSMICPHDSITKKSHKTQWLYRPGLEEPFSMPAAAFKKYELGGVVKEKVYDRSDCINISEYQARKNTYKVANYTT